MPSAASARRSARPVARSRPRTLSGPRVLVLMRTDSPVAGPRLSASTAHRSRRPRTDRAGRSHRRRHRSSYRSISSTRIVRGRRAAFPYTSGLPTLARLSAAPRPTSRSVYVVAAYRSPWSEGSTPGRHPLGITRLRAPKLSPRSPRKMRPWSEFPSRGWHSTKRDEAIVTRVELHGVAPRRGDAILKSRGIPPGKTR